MFDSPPASHHLTDWSNNTLVLFIIITVLVLMLMATSFFIAESFDFDPIPLAAAGVINVAGLVVVYWLHGKIMRHIASDQLVIIICSAGLALGLIALTWTYFSGGDGAMVAIPLATGAIASLGNGIGEWLTRVASSIPLSVGGFVALLFVGALGLVSYVSAKR